MKPPKGIRAILSKSFFWIKAPLLHNLVELLLAESEPHGEGVHLLLLTVSHDLILVDKFTPSLAELPPCGSHP